MKCPACHRHVESGALHYCDPGTWESLRDRPAPLPLRLKFLAIALGVVIGYGLGLFLAGALNWPVR